VATTATLGLVGANIATCTISSMLTTTSFQGVWTSINQIKLFLLLPILVDSIPVDVAYFIYGLDILLFSFDFIPLKDIPIIYDIADLFYFQQDILQCGECRFYKSG
jgi:hypothetical protein